MALKVSNDAIMQAAITIHLQGNKTIPQAVTLAFQLAAAIEERSKSPR